MLLKVKRFKIDMFQKVRQVQPHGQTSEESRTRIDKTVDKNIVFFLYESKQQDNSKQPDHSVSDDNAFYPFKASKKPGNIKHRTEKKRR